MKIDTQTFIDEVMDSIDFSFTESRDLNEEEQQYLLDDIDEYDGPNIVISFKERSGMLIIEAFTSERKASQTAVVMNDNFEGLDNTVKQVNEMVQELLKPAPEEPEDFNSKLGFNDIYNTPEESEETVEDEQEVINCKAYVEPNGEVMFVFDDIADPNGNLSCYAHNGQHGSCDPYYPDECEELSGKDKRVKDLMKEYEDNFNCKLNILPVGEKLPVQKSTHKDISSLD